MRLLFICTHNIARSPMAESLCRDLAAEAQVVVRSAGTNSTAFRRLTTRDVAWADVVVVMEETHLEQIRRLWPDHAGKVRVLGVPDLYAPGEAELRQVLIPKIRALLDELAGC